eukprot:COSAG06_NODE_19802_length_822_cov_0.991701_2_plen_251_part_01
MSSSSLAPISVAGTITTESVLSTAHGFTSNKLEKVKIRLPSSGRIGEEPPQISRGTAAAKLIGASSRETHASRAVSEDHSLFWESSGRTGTHYIDFELSMKCQISSVSIYMDTSDRSFAPKTIEVTGGASLDKRIGGADCPLRNGWQHIKMRSTLSVDRVRVNVKATHGGGTNCRIRGVKFELKPIEQSVLAAGLVGNVTQDRFPIDRTMEALISQMHTGQMHTGHLIQSVDLLRSMRAATAIPKESSAPP